MSKKLWGTRFSKKTSALTDKFTSSISFDKRLAKYDCLGSIAHAKMLGKQGIIPKKDAALIVKGLSSILKDIKNNRFKYDLSAEDIHSNIQEILIKKVGKPALKLHTARSRNDQIALDIKMYIKDEVEDILELIAELQRAVIGLAKSNFNVIIPGYTHLQIAQCVLLAHHLLGYVEGLERDKSRILDAKERLDYSPLGACAFSGTSLNIDRKFVAKELKFKGPTSNSIDSVSDRDFIIEVLADLSILSVHLSRMAEDLILWSTKEFSFIDIDFSFCTGSSIMPHKKNPDILELIRGSVGKIQGNLSSILILMKGLPSSYNRDLQLDKPPLFEAVDTIKSILEIFIPLFKNIVIEKESISARLKDESMFSVDVVEYLIKKGLSYREAHDIVGRMVRNSLDKGLRISDLSLKELKKYSQKFEADMKKMLNPNASVSLKKSFGGTSPENVRKQISFWLNKLG